MDLTNQSVVNYIGDYDYYLEKEGGADQYLCREALLRRHLPKEKSVSEPNFSWQQQKGRNRQRKRENELS